ncbi:hypothetical protein FA15DRAFT_757435 [Coprinopsis marcescibilis]|uniref:Uncharacterized protein n=1 Tax=Coprinopsis marcescibilis TaxID=230819 RepID=A0A5C3KRI4_COPMA|nr:hypothetical protein FA15DRAFT_757435 [Coprinopsis marcescibilis]
MASGTAPFVAFPASDSGHKQIAQPRGPHLPFRRISLPTAPTLLHRQSVVSVLSIDSLPEDRGIYARTGGLRSPTRPMSVESPRRRNRRRESSVKPPGDDAGRLAKRRKIIDEFFETEKAYVEGLDLIYSHFLVPIISSLETPEPILSRTTLTGTFSNFIDIWNFHRSFFAALGTSRDSIAPLLLSHFPYLSLYTPFITQFSSIISSLSELVTPPTPAKPNPQFNATFATFIQTKEADPRCGKLKLRDWLLTIVQRCPRYLLLLKDLIKHTGPDDPELAQLTEVHGLVSKITLALNSSLHAHAQTLALLALQRSTSGLPFQLVSPGRNLVKRGTLLHAERNSPPKPREFLLFSDCLLWLASTDMNGSSWDWDWNMSGWSSSGNGSCSTDLASTSSIGPPRPPPLIRSRSKSEAELIQVGSDATPPSLGSQSRSSAVSGPPSSPLSRVLFKRRSQYEAIPPPPVMHKRQSVGSSDEKWTFRGLADLVDLEVTVGSVLGEERRFEILSPDGSFVIYAASEEEREEWVSLIRQAKNHLLITLNATNPNSTLTSSSSTNHIRKSLQALPFHPSDERLSVLASVGAEAYKVLTPTSPKKAKGKKDKVEVRRKVEHWVPPIWIPDGKTSECMRCGKLFGWRRRRHHCRLCGRCVCAACSDRTFFIADSSGKAESTKPARACDACYETVFPIVEGPSSSTAAQVNDKPKSGVDTISALSNFPAWISMPSLATTKQSAPQALMAIDLDYSADTSLDAEFDEDAEVLCEGEESIQGDNEVHMKEGGVVKLKPHQRLKSYHQILQDFESHEAGSGETADLSGNLRESGEVAEDEDEADEQQDPYPHLFFTPAASYAPPLLSSPRRRKEDTARRSKRYSLPALALQTTPITARASMVIEDDVAMVREEDTPTTTPNRQRRYSILLSPDRNAHISEVVREEDGEASGRSLAADKLSELLSRHTKDS